MAFMAALPALASAASSFGGNKGSQVSPGITDFGEQVNNVGAGDIVIGGSKGVKSSDSAFMKVVPLALAAFAVIAISRNV